eukprot:224624_1
MTAMIKSQSINLTLNEADLDKLSFERDLMHLYTPIVERMQHGEKSLECLLDIIRLRIDAETQYSASLQKIMQRSHNLMEFSEDESLNKHGLNALVCDLKQEYTQRMEYLNSLKQDVQQPLSTMKDHYTSQNKCFAAKTKNSIKILKHEQCEFMKFKAKYNKLLNNGHDTKSKKDQLAVARRKVHLSKTKWKQHEQVFEMDMGSTLHEMEETELKRMFSLRDAFTNWSAYITNLCANRMYDIRDLAKSMSFIDVENDLQCFMRDILNKSNQPKQSKERASTIIDFIVPDLTRRQSDATISFVHTYFSKYHRRTPTPSMSKDFSLSTLALSRVSSNMSVDSLPDVPPSMTSPSQDTM